MHESGEGCCVCPVQVKAERNFAFLANIFASFVVNMPFKREIEAFH